MIYDPKENAFYFLFDYDALTVSLLQQIAGAVWNPSIEMWRVPNPSPISAKQILDLAELQQFNYDAIALERLTYLIALGAETMLQSMASTSSFQIKGLKNNPYPFQIAGIEFGIQYKRVIIADQMGLGKTIQALGILSHLKLFPAIIIVPAIVRLNWAREILAWVSKLDKEDIITLYGQKPYKFARKSIVLINYDILPYWLSVLLKLKPKAIIFDEIHYAKSGTSKRGKASRLLAKNIEYVIGLTGTPILNRPEELINPLKIINRLDELGGQKYFEKRYCAAQKDNFGRWNTSGAANLKELNDRLRSTGIFIRRNKKDVLPDLPKKLPPTIIPFELDNKAEYTRAEKDLAKWLGQKAIEDEDFKKSISHLDPHKKSLAILKRRQSVEWRARQNEELRKFTALKRLSTEGKFAGIKEYLNEFLQSEEKIVVFGWFVDTQRDFVVQWPTAVHALGTDSDATRNEAIDRFQNDPSCKLLIASLKAIGIGVNLTAAHYVAFAELGWTPADHDQAEDRLDRIGQKFPVSPIYFVGINTIEEDIIDIIDKKRRIIGEATDGVSHADESVRKLLIGKLLTKYKTSE